MREAQESRRGFLKGLAAGLGGLGLLAVAATPAQAGRSHWRRGYWGGYRRSHNRGWYGPRVYPRGYYGGYPGGYGGYGGYYRAPYGAPYVAPVPAVPAPMYYNNYYYPPILQNGPARAADALGLLDA